MELDSNFIAFCKQSVELEQLNSFMTSCNSVEWMLYST
ncbi:hypothetical protein BN3659_00752 [Alistipes sp. CHKCI003]|nr:hypothetical protein BN3659_00752 [Alistipes sp. CHKCI003]